jgi:Transcription factor e(y)2
LVQILTDHPQWFDNMRQKTREVLQRKEGGVLDITLDELSMELVQEGERAVPEELKQAFLSHIQSSIQAAGTRR